MFSNTPNTFLVGCATGRFHVYCVAAAACWLSPLAAAAVLPSAHLVSMHVGMLDHRGFLRTPKEGLTRAIGHRSGASEGGMSSHMITACVACASRRVINKSRKLVLNGPRRGDGRML